MLERTTGIEPASSAWEADILPMNYVRVCICLASVLPTPAACKSLCKNISPDAERLRLRLTARRSPSLGHLSCICSAFAVAPPLKCHALKRCTFWRETCLASAFALRLVNQRARAANQRARAANQRARAANRSAKYIIP